MPDFIDRFRLDSREGARSFYESLRAKDDDPDLEDGRLRTPDVENAAGPSNLAPSSAARTGRSSFTDQQTKQDRYSMWMEQEEGDDDVPASLLMENNAGESVQPLPSRGARKLTARSEAKPKAQLEGIARQDTPYDGVPSRRLLGRPSAVGSLKTTSRREKALWAWVNTSNLDRFMRDVYDYYEGGGMWCIMCSNALWLL